MSVSVNVTRATMCRVAVPVQDPSADLSGNLMDVIRQRYDVFTRPDDENEIILDISVFEDEMIDELCELIGISDRPEDIAILREATYVCFFLNMVFEV